MAVKANWDIRSELRVLNYAGRVKNISKDCQQDCCSKPPNKIPPHKQPHILW